jgi:hypothetical protein
MPDAMEVIHHQLLITLPYMQRHLKAAQDLLPIGLNFSSASNKNPYFAVNHRIVDLRCSYSQLKTSTDRFRRWHERWTQALGLPENASELGEFEKSDDTYQLSNLLYDAEETLINMEALIEKAYFMRQQIEGNQKSQVSYKVGGV